VESRNYGRGVLENHELRDLTIDNFEDMHVRIIEGDAGRLRPHSLREEHDNVLALSDESVGLKVFARDNLARSLDELYKLPVPLAIAGERPDRLRHRMLKIEVIGEQRQQALNIVALER
jgi:hypothetical protein